MSLPSLAILSLSAIASGLLQQHKEAEGFICQFEITVNGKRAGVWRMFVGMGEGVVYLGRGGIVLLACAHFLWPRDEEWREKLGANKTPRVDLFLS